LIGLCVVAAAVAAAWAVVASSATRLPGEEISGVALGPQALAQSLQQAQQAADRGDALTAVKDYQKILDHNPNQTEALTGEGWLLAQTQQPTLLKQGLTMLQQAERADPTYAPAHVYRGIGLLSEDDYTDAIPELKWYLAHSPDPQLASQVRAALQQAEAQAAAAAAAAKPKG
jgi:tetratricopeptide (TPR) repeat protein